ncbi:hypothetical protein AURDEDRAFT_64644 [Auricularia subglabra TFB-10046 SS5]|nr:hypothetical protein AURDEDRAFT_64644 [Auricularia subglabra TFB-10046 SS5]
MVGVYFKVVQESQFAPADAPELSPEEIHERLRGIYLHRTGDYAPYKNKTMFLLDLLDSLPRLRLSNAHLEFILWILMELGVHDVPSLYALRQVQKQLRTKLCLGPEPQQSVRGNRFFTNSVTRSISLHFGNPQVCKHMRFYPEAPQDGVSEHWQTRRRLLHAPELLTPMAINSHNQHFYVGEFAQLRNGRFVVPFLWIYRCGILHARFRYHSMSSLGPFRSYLKGVRFLLSPVSAFQTDAVNLMPHVDVSTSYCKKMPNPLRIIAKGHPLYTVFVHSWADDVSGNVSKQYNKHMNMYVVNASLPASLLRQEFFITFVSTSQHASAAEQFAALKREINGTHTNPVPCFNASTRSECLFRLVGEGFFGDNPQQSDDCSHMTGQSLCNCRKCHNTRSVPNSNEEAAASRAMETKLAIEKQLKTACAGKPTHVSELQKESGSKDSIAQYWIELLLKRAQELRNDKTRRWTEAQITEHLTSWLEAQSGERYHPLLDWIGLRVDPHRDTPVEILHTILLGIVKYISHHLTTSWSAAQKAEFVTRLQSTDMHGLSCPPMRAAYMMQYSNGLIGKHFKALAQTMVFHVHGMTSDDEFELVKAIGALCTHLWHEKIDEKEYLADLKILVANVLDGFAAIDPLRILEKAKLHLLAHFEDDVPMFGPPLLAATEVFECFNAVFRMCSVLSNHQAPSRDIALSLANMDRMKYILCGGVWKDGDMWAEPSEKVREVLFTHPIVQRHLGWVPKTKMIPGKIQMVGRKKQELVSWSSIPPNTHINIPGITNDQLRTLQFLRGNTIVSTNGDICPHSSWVVFKFSEGEASVMCIGRITCILVPQSTAFTTNLVVVERFGVGEQLHPKFDMPVLTKLSNGPTHHIISPEDLCFAVNVQHDCRLLNCGISTSPQDTVPVVQERFVTDLRLPAVKHKSDDHFVLNMHAMHNATRLRKVLPVALVKPRLRFIARELKHAEWEQKAFNLKSAKRIRTSEKRAATLAAKKKTVPAVEDDSGDDSA